MALASVTSKTTVVTPEKIQWIVLHWHLTQNLTTMHCAVLPFNPWRLFKASAFKSQAITSHPSLEKVKAERVRLAWLSVNEAWAVNVGKMRWNFFQLPTRLLSNALSCSGNHSNLSLKPARACHSYNWNLVWLKFHSFDSRGKLSFE